MRHDQEGYERTDADAPATYRAGIAMLAAMFLTALLVVPLYWLWAKRETRAQPPPAEVVKTEMSEPVLSFPKLVTSEPQALAAFRAQEDALLTSYGWVEKDKGVVRIPIAEAMKMVAEHGLPKWQAPPSAAAKSAGPEGGK